jgi:hypothetical protein
MDYERRKELNFMLRTGSPIPVTDSRSAEIFQTIFYSDFYTLQELIGEGLLEYIGHQKSLLCLRPLKSFPVYVSDEVRDLKASEIVTMSLTTSGRSEFEQWLAAKE